MNVVLIKLLSIYYPDLYVAISKRSVLIDLIKHFQIDCDLSLSPVYLSYILKKNLKDSDLVQTLDDYDLWHYLWKFHEAQLSDEELITPAISDKNIWLFSPGPNAENWDESFNRGIISLVDTIGDIRDYETKDDIRKKYLEIDDSSHETSYKNRVLARWEFAHEMKVGDIVYAKKGRRTILGKGIVQSEYIYDPSMGKFASYRKVNWLFKGEYDHTPIGDMVIKTLTEVSKYQGYPEKIEALFGNNESITNVYGRQEFLQKAFISDELYDSIINNLTRKKNIILQGPPGVGKTYLAKRIFYSLMGEIDDTHIEMVQFHQSYSYEDFVQGYRPNDEGHFELKEGVLYKIVQKARQAYENNPEDPKKYCIIIDEINRGNLSKILGELLMLIDHDKRDKYWSIKLTYSDEEFYIPQNLYIIGTMNTADRSLSIVDYALRRRFAFITLPVAYSSAKFKQYMRDHENLEKELVDKIIKVFTSLNMYVHESLGKGFLIGHSYFVNQLNKSEDIETTIKEIIDYEIKPLLEEYYYDDEQKVKDAGEILRELL